MKCQHCERDILNKGSLISHEQSCNFNPNRIKHKRGKGAGAKKGSVSWNAGKKVGRAVKWDERFPLDKVLIENSTYARVCLKKRILVEKLIPYHCACCGIEPVWNGKPMPLILDHINGINNDNRLENLRFVCSNCDSQLDTYKSRNKK